MAIWGSREWQAVAALCVASAVAAIYGAEASIAFRGELIRPAPAGDRAGDKAAAVVELAQREVKAYPAPWPAALLGAQGNGIQTATGAMALPLSGVADVLTVFCDEGYGRVQYLSDSFGFRNPRESWDGPVVVVVGDSFAQGARVPDGKTIVDPLRTRWRTVNLGMVGNGPLLERATLAEYGPMLKPRVVVWLFCEDNDLTEMMREGTMPLLTAYLEGGSQGLAARREEVSQALEDWLTAGLTGVGEAANSTHAPMRPSPRDASPPGWADLIALRHLRAALGLYHIRLEPEAVALFRRTLIQANVLVSSWGGQMLFVHLPSRPRVMGGVASGYTRAVAVFINEVVDRLGIPVVDLGHVLDAEPNPDDFFAPRGPHFSIEGYRRIGEELVRAVAAKLERGGPRKSGRMLSCSPA